MEAAVPTLELHLTDRIYQALFRDVSDILNRPIIGFWLESFRRPRAESGPAYIEISPISSTSYSSIGISISIHAEAPTDGWGQETRKSSGAGGHNDNRRAALLAKVNDVTNLFDFLEVDNILDFNHNRLGCNLANGEAVATDVASPANSAGVAWEPLDDDQLSFGADVSASGDFMELKDEARNYLDALCAANSLMGGSIRHVALGHTADVADNGDNFPKADKKLRLLVSGPVAVAW